ncbi:hypothetical protein [Nakamurella lactea]|uniref:hypothetical protein n=1 Tax=Nakamurella lactea TaxID=459515 RepID=UPI0003FED3D7|nr:hypothetical protein [Nakamurella lactea]
MTMSEPDLSPDQRLDRLAGAQRDLVGRLGRLESREQATADSIRANALARTAQAAIGPIVLLVIGMFAPFIEVRTPTDGDVDPIEHFSVLGVLGKFFAERSARHAPHLTSAGFVLLAALLVAIIAALVAGSAARSATRSSSRAGRIVCGWAAALGIVALAVARMAMPGGDSDLDVSLQFGVVVLACGYLWAAAVANSEQDDRAA